jgi:RNAse (barnase) inhibitor barstar
MAVVRLDTTRITDKASFHLVCEEAFGFPGFYGRNMDAWIDCMSYLTEDGGMTRFILAENEMLHIELTDTEDFNSRLPEIFNDLVACTAFVNNRYIEAGENTRISLICL